MGAAAERRTGERAVIDDQQANSSIDALLNAERDAERWRTYLQNYPAGIAIEMTAAIDKQIAERKRAS